MLTIATLILMPFFLVLFGEWLIPGVRFYSFEVYLVAHIGATILSCGMVILLYSYSKRQSLQLHYLLLSLYASWTVVELGLIFASLVRLPITLNQTLVPYVTGSFASIILLAMIVRQLRQPQIIIRDSRWWWVWIGAAVIGGLILLGEVLQFSLHSATTSASGNPLDRMFLMGFTIVIMFLFTLVGFLMLEHFQSRVTVEQLALGYLALWILPSLLKSITRQWTLGWWVGEFLLLTGLLSGPVILGMAYLQVLGRAESMRRYASLYSDLLIHDIGNFHQIIQSSIDLLDLEGVTPAMEQEAKRHARLGLLRAHYLISNVRQLSRIVETREEMCEPVDLVDSIEQGLQQALSLTQTDDVEFQIIRPEGHCRVLATDLLKTLFSNLLRNAIEYSPEEKRIQVEIKPVHHDEKAWWEIRVIDYGRGIEPKLKPKLFERFLEGAQGTGLGLSVVWALTQAFGGSITIVDRVPGDYTQGSVFIVILEATTEPVS
jgi:signal transduction histidine kinase